MSIRNRELSQFGSFIYIDDTTKTVGIATTATPYVGIGTTNASSKLTVVGNTNISGDTVVGGSVSATSYYLNGTLLVDAALQQPWDVSASNIYRLNGNVGIGTSVLSSKLSVSGDTDITGVVNASRFISTVSTGTPPFNVSSSTLVSNLNTDLIRGRTPPVGDFVGSSDNQTLTNKTLESPIVSGAGISFTGSTSGITTLSAQLVASGTILLPAISGIGTVVTTADVGTITSEMIENLSIVNADIAVGAGITYGKLSLTNSLVNADIAAGAGITNGKLANSTISGVSLGSNLNALTAGSFISYNSGTTYNGSSAVTISVNATPSNNANTVIARDSANGFNSGALTVTSSNISLNGNGSALFGPNSTWSAYLRVGGNGNADTTNASVVATNGNLHIDARTGTYATYLNYYKGTSGVAFGNGASGIVAWMGPDGDLWKGSGDNTGSVYWHAGNDGSGSGLDADLLDGINSTSFARVDSTSTFTVATYFQSNLGTTSGSLSSPPLQAYATGTNSAFMSFHRGGSYAVNFGLDSDNILRIGGWSASANRWQLDMSGNMTVAGNVTAYSDIRLKEEIVPLQSSLSKLLTLNGVSFKWKNIPDIVGHPGKKDFGIIAQEVEKVFPEIIQESSQESPDGDNYKTVAYDKLVPVLIEAIKEQQEQINILKEEINKLKK